MMRLLLLLAVLLMSALGASAVTAAAQEQDQEQDVSCATLTAEEAQALLDADPTYANREPLDANDDGIACNEPETGDCTSLTAEEAQALLDADPTYANRERLDPDDDGIACEDESDSPRSTITTPPVVGTGTAVATSTSGPVFALVGLAMMFGVAAIRGYRRI